VIRRPPRSTLSSSSAASDVYKRQMFNYSIRSLMIKCLQELLKLTQLRSIMLVKFLISKDVKILSIRFKQCRMKTLTTLIFDRLFLQNLEEIMNYSLFQMKMTKMLFEKCGKFALQLLVHW